MAAHPVEAPFRAYPATANIDTEPNYAKQLEISFGYNLYVCLEGNLWRWDIGKKQTHLSKIKMQKTSVYFQELLYKKVSRKHWNAGTQQQQLRYAVDVKKHLLKRGVLRGNP